MRVLSQGLAALAALCLTLTVSAGMPGSGSYTYSAEGDSSLGVWDVSGTFTDDAFAANLGGDYTISVDAAGKITGGGTVSLSESGINMDMNFAFSGTIKTVKGITTVQMNMKISAKGKVYYGGESYSYSVSGLFKYGLSIDPANCTMDGTISGKVSVSVMGYKETVDLGVIDFSVSLVENGMDGSWDVTVTLGNDAKGKLAVLQARVTLSNARTVDLGGKFSYRAKVDVTSLTLKGVKDFGSAGASLKLTGVGSGIDVQACSGKLFGQPIASE